MKRDWQQLPTNIANHSNGRLARVSSRPTISDLFQFRDFLPQL
jgi:hypothetical protein